MALHGITVYIARVRLTYVAYHSQGSSVLQEVGVELDKDQAIRVDPYSRTTVDNIWSVGDVTNRMPLTPAAIMEGMAFAATCFGNRPTMPVFEKVCLRNPLSQAVLLHASYPAHLFHAVLSFSRLCPCNMSAVSLVPCTNSKLVSTAVRADQCRNADWSSSPAK